MLVGQEVEINHDGTPNAGTVVVGFDCGASTDDCYDNLGAADLNYVWMILKVKYVPLLHYMKLY